MFTREQSQVTPKNSQRDLARTKRLLRRKGYSYREAAPLLDVSYQHLCLVLNGRRISNRLLSAIPRLPALKEGK